MLSPHQRGIQVATGIPRLSFLIALQEVTHHVHLESSCCTTQIARVPKLSDVHPLLGTPCKLGFCRTNFPLAVPCLLPNFDSQMMLYYLKQRCRCPKMLTMMHLPVFNVHRPLYAFCSLRLALPLLGAYHDHSLSVSFDVSLMLLTNTLLNSYRLSQTATNHRSQFLDP